LYSTEPVAQLIAVLHTTTEDGIFVTKLLWSILCASIAN